MKKVNQKAKKTLDTLTAGLDNAGDHKKIDNTDGVFMAVVVEHIGTDENGPMFSVAHYYTQNGDLVADPEMAFLRGFDGNYYPLHFQTGGYFQRAWDVAKGTFSPRACREQATFAGQWMKNISYQQSI
jgi:hypothetical protein